MIDVKVSLNIELQGRKMLSEEECLKTIQKEITIKHGKNKGKTMLVEKRVEDYSKHTLKSFWTDGDKKKGIKPEKIVYYVRNYVPATQHINISRDQYKDMVSKDICPDWEKPYMWAKMSNEKRIKSHLEMIAKGLNGKLIDFHVFED